MNNIERQIELEKKMTQVSVEKYRREFEKHKQQDNFANSTAGNIVMQNSIKPFVEAVNNYLDNYGAGKAVRSTIAARVIGKIGAQTCCYIACKVILNTVYKSCMLQPLSRAIGQALEDEYKMCSFKKENKHYYESIQKDLNSRGAKSNRKKFITQIMFKKRLDFHSDTWSISEKIQAGMILTELFVNSTNLFELHNKKEGKKIKKILVATPDLIKIIDDLNIKLEVMQPFYLPMLTPPKAWTGIFEGGYLSPYLRKNKVIKNNDREYLKKLSQYSNTRVYEALNTIQNTAWQINSEVLEVVKALWEEGQAVAGLPKRDDEPLSDYPFPNATKDTVFTAEEKQIIAKWKRDTYEAHKQNIAQRSNRLLTGQILRIADKFKDEEAIWFPYQMDFRGRMYPIPALLQPQGSDLAKGLLRFARGKPIEDNTALNWWKIHGANVFGYDKASYKDRVKWVDEHHEELLKYADKPLENRGWIEADKPFQFLSWCFEYFNYFYTHNIEFTTHIPIQLDGTCNGLQHYSALLKDEISGSAVNLVNSEIPSDIYAKVAEKLTEKLKGIKNDNNSDTLNPIWVPYAGLWLSLGINRKLTKRPVMVLPYGGTQLSCRQYIQAYLEENYSKDFLWKHFKIGNNPNDCIFKVSNWLSKYLWEAIKETLKSAIVGMDYLKSLTRATLKYKNAIEWTTPLGLLIHQAYKKSKTKQADTELFGKMLQMTYKSETEDINKMKQLNGICPNFIHSLDASCLMLWLLKCKEAGINQFMSVHDCYGVLAPDTEKSAKLLREAFVEIYQRPILDDFRADLTDDLPDTEELPPRPQEGDLRIEEVMKSNYFFN